MANQVCLIHFLNDKVLAKIKIKAFADNKLKAVQMMIFVFNSLPHNHVFNRAFENIVGKGENVGNQHLSFSQNCLPFANQISIFHAHLQNFVVCKCFQFGPVLDFDLLYWFNPFPHNDTF